MSLIIIIATIWSISALISHIKQARLAKEQNRQREAQARLLREQRAQAQAQREETARLIALEKARQAQEKMNEKFEREQAKQAAQLAKHEKRISDLELKVRKLDRDIKREYETLADYYAQLDWLLLQQSGTTPSGKEFAGWQNKIVTKNNQIRKVEGKIEDMKDAKEKAQRELTA